jgi:hypothetical protein
VNDNCKIDSALIEQIEAIADGLSDNVETAMALHGVLLRLWRVDGMTQEVMSYIIGKAIAATMIFHEERPHKVVEIKTPLH